MFNIITVILAGLSFCGSLWIHWHGVQNIKKENEKNRTYNTIMQMVEGKSLDESLNLVNDPKMTKLISKIENTNLDKIKNKSKKYKKINTNIIAPEEKVREQRV